MAEGFNLDLNSKLLKTLDEHRGDLSRDEFIKQILQEHLNKPDRINFSKLKNSDQGIDSQDLAILIDNFQEFANHIYDRLDRLENIMNNNVVSDRQETNSDPAPERDGGFLDLDEEHEHSSRYTPKQNQEDTDGEESFEILESEAEVTYEPETYNDDDENVEYFTLDKKKEQSGTGSEAYNIADRTYDDEFEYGCPFCSATIEKDATYCTNCGHNLDELAEDVEDSTAIVEPLSEGYSESGEYDPRPNYLKRREPGEYRAYHDKEYPGPRPKIDHRYAPATPKARIPRCSFCGSELRYLKDYNRWYCYHCKKYFGGPPAKPGQPGEEDRPARAQPLVQHRERPPDSHPLKDYHRYRPRK